MQRRTLRLRLAGLTAIVTGAAALTLMPGLASAATQAQAASTSRARGVRSPRLPIGVATT